MLRTLFLPHALPTRALCRSPSLSYLRIVQRRAYSSPSAGKEAYLEPHVGVEGITYLTLNRPSAKNAISVKLLDEMEEAIDEARFDGRTRALIVRSTVPGTFCAGADLKERRTMSPSQVDRFLLGLRRTFTALEQLPLPTIAALDGLAMGGGLELALCCDIRVAGPSATRLGLTETRLAIIPGAGGTQRLTRLLGPSKAKDLIFSSRLLNAQQAHEVGLVDHLAVAAAAGEEKGNDQAQAGQSRGTEAVARAVELAEEMVPNGPLAIKAAKLAIDRGIQVDLESALDFERQCYATILHTKDRLEGLKAFAEKRKPIYRGE